MDASQPPGFDDDGTTPLERLVHRRGLDEAVAPVTFADASGAIVAEHSGFRSDLAHRFVTVATSARVGSHRNCAPRLVDMVDLDNDGVAGRHGVEHRTLARSDTTM
jgi:hypothetical protein